MKKRVMSLLLVMLMVFALLPAAAFAAVPATESTKDNMNMTKSIQQAADGTYSVTLESWATGQVDVSHQTEKVPTDIVLVLDQSGSMDDDLVSYSYKATSITLKNLYDELDSYYHDTYYYQDGDGNRYEVRCSRSGNNNNRTYTVYYYDNNYNYTVIKSGKGTATVELYTRTENSTSRLDALKAAVNTFIANVAAQQNDDGTRVDHKIAIVGFADGDNTYYYSNNSSYKLTDYDNTEVFNGTTQTGYKSVTEQTLKDALKAADSSDLTASVGKLEADGATYPQYGLDLALRILNAREDQTRAAAVVLFTDGNPGWNTSAGDQYATANKAVEKAKAIKDKGATLFTVGLLTSDSTKLVNGGNYSIRDFMQATSSDYLGNVSLSDTTAAKKNSDGIEYYKTTTGSDGLSLEDLFTTIQRTITGETTVDLDVNAYLKDVINTDNFALPENFSASNVSAVTVKGSANEDGEISFDSTSDGTIPADQIQVSGNTVKVSGFDYKANYIAYNKPANTTAGTEANQGRKLVVTINGLTPKTIGTNLESNFEAGVYASNDGEAITIGSPSIDLTTKESYIIDFNTKMVLKGSYDKLGFKTSNNGQFALSNDGELTYQLFPTETLGDRYANLVMNSVDTAMTYANSGKVWTQHTTIPANNVYFDDSLLSEKVSVGDGSGLNLQIPASTDTNAVATNGERFAFTFTGTAVDVYCTTDTEGGVIQAALYEGNVIDQVQAFEKDNTQKPTAKPISETAFSMRNYSETERLNVPTVHIVAPEGYGTYTVYIYAMKGSNYKLDGVRVYNAMPDQSVYAGSNEANAKFFNLRDYLINDGKSVQLTDPSKQDLTDEETKNLTGVLFVDDPTSVTAERTTANPDGTPVRDAQGNKVMTPVYDNAFEAYKANGPKNEIYLAGPAEGKDGQMITFKIDKDNVNADHYWLGLSAPDQGANAGTVQINGKDYEINSAVDMYYPITPYDDGTVVVRNTGSALISVTNLKTTGNVAADVSAEIYAHPFAVLSEESLNLMANRGAAPAAEETQPEAENSLQTIIRNLISSFVQHLFSSISRMFGN